MKTPFRFEDLRIPVIQAPMAGSGINTPELVIASCRAGVLGSLAVAYRTTDQIRSDVTAIRSATDAPFAVNLFAPTSDPTDPGETGAILQFLARWHEQCGLPVPEIPTKPAEAFAETIELLIELRPAIVSFTFGVLPTEVMQRLHAAGIIVIGTATTTGEALELEASGVDAVVAQGSEAGGHRGSFSAPTEGGLVGLMTLVPQVVNAVNIPVIASGGIMDGRGIAAALTLGATAVQMGTAFLLTHESGAPRCYKDRVSAATDQSTVLTKAFSGRMARGIDNDFARELRESGIAPLPYPWQNALTRNLRSAGIAAGNADVLSLWAGQGATMAREQSVAELVDELEQGLRDANARRQDEV